MKPADIKSSTYIDFNKENNEKESKLKVSDDVKISKNKSIFAKGYIPNWSEEVFVMKKNKNSVLWTYIISDPKGKEIFGTFYEKELQKTNEKEFRMEKVIERKDNNRYIKWKNYNNSFISCIDKKYIVI